MPIATSKLRRPTDALIDKRSYGRDSVNPMSYLRYGGQFGYAPKHAEWVNAQPHVSSNMVIKMLTYPGVFDNFRDGREWKLSLKSLIETHPVSIEGFQAGITIETDSVPLGGDGQTLEAPTDAKTPETKVTLNYKELYGRAIANFWINYARMAIKDPATKYAGSTALPSDNRPTDHLPDQYSFSFLAYEPDAIHKNVVEAWLCDGQFPKGDIHITGKRDVTGPGELSDLAISLAGFAHTGYDIRLMAQEYIDEINMVNANAFHMPRWLQGTDPDLEGADVNGYVEGIDKMTAANINP